jgi:subtilisin family serine protease
MSDKDYEESGGAEPTNGSGDVKAIACREIGREPERPELDRRTARPSFVPGVIEVLFNDWVLPEIDPPLEAKAFAFRGDEAIKNVEKVNRILSQYEIVKIEQTFSMSRSESAAVQQVAEQQELTTPNLADVFTLYFPEDKNVERIARRLNQLEEVAEAAPLPRTMPAQLAPNEPLLGSSDILSTGPTVHNQWYIFRCRINKAWPHATGKGTIVAVIDAGYRTTHLDLKDRLDPIHRYNAIDGGNCVSKGDSIEHGTGVMGLVGAGDNDFGMIGVAFEADLWPIQASTFPDDCPQAWANGIEWVMKTDGGPKRKVLLLEGQTLSGSNLESILAVRCAVRHAIAMGIIVCVAAGNGNKDAGVDDKKNHFPPTGSILVGATRYMGNGGNPRLRSSNWGTSVTVAAPGDGLYDVTCGAGSDNCYVNGFGGTSGAAAKVAGTAALMLQANPYIRHSDVRDILGRIGPPVCPPSKPIGRFLDGEAAVIAARCAPRWGTAWRPLSVQALDIGFGTSQDSLWGVGLDHSVSRWSGEGWKVDAAGPAVKIAVGPDGAPWYISTEGYIHTKIDDQWQPTLGRASDIAIGADGSVWRVGLDHTISRWDGNDWVPFSPHGQALKIAVAPDGRPWFISAEHEIFEWSSNVWQQVPRRASDIAIGADGSVWQVGIKEPCQEGRMRRWNGVTWEPIDGHAIAIAVAPNGLPFYIADSDYVFERI